MATGSSWRPEGWEGIRDMCVGKEEDGFIGKVSVNAFEIGADAMLEALKARGKHCEIDIWSFKNYNIFAGDFGKSGTRGTLTFVPDEE